MSESCGSLNKPDFRLLCADSDAYASRFFALAHFLIVPYRWNEVLVLRDSKGVPQGVRNLSIPKSDPNGMPIRATLELRDLNFGLVADLLADRTFKIDQINVQVDPDERFAYAPCARRSDSASEASADYYSLCRYRLDGRQNGWEHIVYVEELKTKARAHIKSVDVDRSGNVYFSSLGHPPYNGIWMYEAKSGKVSRVTHQQGRNGDDGPKVSPGGGKVAFVRTGDKSVLHILRWSGK
jgi:hypothetical protein